MPLPDWLGPHTLTILCTYQCTAACKQCCFESSPAIRGRLSKETIIARITEAKTSFPSLKVVVFSGGEAMMLKDDLFAAIAYCTAEGLRTRIVSNGYWGRTPRSASVAVNKLKDAGLSELNISTGVDHRQWVPLDSVVNAAVCAAEAGMFCLVTVESESSDERVVDQLMDNPRFARQVRQGAVSFQSNSWMPFNTGAEDRKQEVDLHELRRGCAQVIDTVVVTPHDNLSACCGLALEHIPELRLGRNDGQNMEALYTAQLDDFLKLWLRVSEARRGDRRGCARRIHLLRIPEVGGALHAADLRALGPSERSESRRRRRSRSTR